MAQSELNSLIIHRTCSEEGRRGSGTFFFWLTVMLDLGFRTPFSLVKLKYSANTVPHNQTCIQQPGKTWSDCLFPLKHNASDLASCAFLENSLSLPLGFSSLCLLCLSSAASSSSASVNAELCWFKDQIDHKAGALIYLGKAQTQLTPDALVRVGRGCRGFSGRIFCLSVFNHNAN